MYLSYLIDVWELALEILVVFLFLTHMYVTDKGVTHKGSVPRMLFPSLVLILVLLRVWYSVPWLHSITYIFSWLCVFVWFYRAVIRKPSSAQAERVAKIQQLWQNKTLGHRGSRYQGFNENTLPSFCFALDSGCGGMEFDVLLTKDNVPVIFHDIHIDKLLEGTGPLSSYTYKELQEIPFKKPLNRYGKPHQTSMQFTALESDRVITLYMLIDFVKRYEAQHPHKGKICFLIETKEGYNTIKFLHGLLRDLFIKEGDFLFDRAVVGSFNFIHTFWMKWTCPAIPVAHIFEQDSFQKNDLTFPGAGTFNNNVIKWLLDLVLVTASKWGLPQLLQCEMVNVPAEQVSAFMVSWYRRTGIYVCTWGINNVHELAHFTDLLRVSAITDDTFPALTDFNLKQSQLKQEQEQESKMNN